MDKVIFCIMGFALGFVMSAVYFEYEIDKTGGVQLDSKTYTCKEYKGESK
jgi:hypothetical protein